MPDRNPIEQLQRRLVELGCPAKAVRRIVRETAEHYEDLQRAAQAQGLADDQAVAQAAELLGNPVELANRHVEALRNSSWWVRCPQFAFGILPLLVALELGLQYFGLNHGKLPIDFDNQLINHPVIVGWAYPAFFLAVIAVTAAVTFFFVRHAQRYGVAHRWMWITAIILALHGLFLQIHDPRKIRLILNQPVALSNQKVAPDHSMGIHIGSNWTKPDRLALYQLDDYNILAMPEGSKGKTYSSPDLAQKINVGVAEVRQRSMNGQLLLHSLHDPAWSVWYFSRDWHTKWANGIGIINTVLEVDRDDAGNLNWRLCTQAMFPWPELKYGLPGLGYGDVFQVINIACPLLIVASMLAWERRRGKRLLHQSDLTTA